jgi:pilus assembly protein CpaE
VDLNFQDGAIADYLDLTPAFQLSELANMPRRLDRQLLDVMLTRHRSGMAVLAAPRVQGKFLEIGADLVAAILGLLSEAFDHLIIDLPGNWYPWTDNVIWGSDRIFVVTGFTVPGLRNSRLLADAIAAKVAGNTGVSVIVNKFHEPLIGAGLSRKDAETILENRLGGFIPGLGRIVDDAINEGRSLSESRAGNKIEKRLREILYGSSRSKKAE